MKAGILYALAAAALFGVSTPLSKLLLGSVEPSMLAGELYLGSGLGLAAWYLLRARTRREASLKGPDLPWLAGAIAFGGVAGPLLMMRGLASTAASSSALILNLEGVFTALLAWFVFKENFDGRIFLGMVCIIAGGVVLSWNGSAVGFSWGALLIVGACLAWAVDNNLTRRISSGDPVQIAMLKGLTAGCTNVGIALGTGHSLPPATVSLVAAFVGFVCFGLSLSFFVLALRHVGTARTSAYFSTAPFVGVVVSIVGLREDVTAAVFAAGALMAAGLWLHLTEEHDHEHCHACHEHEHGHGHDDGHHDHDHEHDLAVSEAWHSHWHRHEATWHSHAHYPDAHHLHSH